MKNFTKIGLILALVLVILGSVFCTVSLCLGFDFSEFRQDVEDGQYVFGPIGSIGNVIWNDFQWKDNGGFWNGAVKDEYTFEWKRDGEEPQIDKLYLDVYYGSVYIVENTKNEDEVYVKVEYRKKNHRRDVEASMDGTELNIRETGSKRSINNDSTRVTIYIPKDMADGKDSILKEITIHQNAGDIFVDIPLTAEEINITENAGECDVSAKLNAKNKLTVEVNAGEMDLNNIKASELTLKTGVGELDVEKMEADNISVDCGVGSIDASVRGREDDYDYEISCNMGEVSIGDESYGGMGMSKEIHNGRDKKMQINCGVGEVDISFDD